MEGLELTSLAFKVETKELKDAITVLEGLAKAVGTLHKVQKEQVASDKAATAAALDKLKVDKAAANVAEAQAKAEEATTKALTAKNKAVKDTTSEQESSTKATKSNIDILQRQKDILDFMTQGYSRGQAATLATAKATGTLTESMKELGNVLLTQRKITGGNPFDKSQSGLVTLNTKLLETKETIRQFNNESGLTSKQAQELARDKERLIIKLRTMGMSYLEVGHALRDHEQRYIALANRLNIFTKEQEMHERQIRESANAYRALEREEDRMLSVVNSLNNVQSNGVGINEKAARSIAAYEANLKRAGITGEQAASKLALYKKQQMEVMQIEQKRQVQYLQRGLQPQIGDVVVSLAGGQNPLTVLLQQGDQIRGLIAQTGVEGKALQDAMAGAMGATIMSIKQTGQAMLQVLGGAVTSVGKSIKDFFVVGLQTSYAVIKDAAANSGRGLLEMGRLLSNIRQHSDEAAVGLASMSPATANLIGLIEKLSLVLTRLQTVGILAIITGLIAMGAAMLQTMKQSTALSQNLTLQGAKLGLTSKEAYHYAEAITQAGISTSKAVAVISEMAKVGGIGKESIAMITEAAVGLEKYGGVAIEDTVKQFGKLREKPVEALTELAIATGRINPEIIEQVRNLTLQGRSAEAAALAMQAYGNASKSSIESLKGDLSKLELAWKDMADSIVGVWDKFKAFVENSPTLVAELTTIAAEIAAPFKLIGAVLDRLNGKQAWQIRRENTEPEITPTVASGLSKEQLQANSELAAAQDKVNKLEDKYATNKTPYARAKAINEMREATMDYYRKANKGESELQIAERARLKIQEMIANMDYKAPSNKENHTSATYEAPSDNTLVNLQKQHASNMKKLQKIGEDERKINKSNFEAATIDKEVYLAKDLDLLKKSESDQLAAIKEFEIESSAAYTDSILTAIKNRDTALAKAAGSKNPAESRAKIMKDYIQNVTNLGNNFETLTLQANDTRDALRSTITQKEVDAIASYGRAVKDNEEESKKWAKTQADFVTNREIERELQDKIANAYGHEADAIAAMQEEQQKWTTEISRTREELIKSKIALDALNGTNASPQQVAAAQEAYAKQMAIHQKTVADSRVAIENAGSDSIVEYYKKEFARISNELEDVVVTFLFEGGKKGSKKLRESIIAELKKPVTMVVKAVVNTIMGDVTGGLLGNKSSTGLTAGDGSGIGGVGGLMSNIGSFLGGNSFGVGLDQFAIKAGAYVGDALNSFAPNLAASLEKGIQGLFASSSAGGVGAGAAGVSNMAYGVAGIGGGLFGSLFGGQGSMGGSIGATAGMALSGGNPLMGALGALAGSLIGSLFGGGTPYNTGGNYTANADGTGKRVSDRAELTALIPNLGKAGYQDFSKRGSSEIDSATKDLATNMLGSLNPILKEFGKDSVDFINVAFRANGKKATGNLNISGTTTNFKTGENDPEKAFVQFGNFAADQIVETLKQAGLPQWAEDLLNEVPKNSGIEGLKAVLTTINQVQELTKVFNNLPMANLKTITTEATIELIKMAGGLDALTNSLSSYYNNFYSAEDKAAVQMQNLARDFKALGIDIVPKTRQAFVDLVNSQDLTTEAGREMYLELLNLQQGLSDVLPPLEDLSKTLEEVTNDAFAKLEEAVSAQKDYYSTLKDNAKASVDSLKGIFDLLATNIRELYNSVQETSGMSAASGRALISKAATTGVLPNQEELATAISSVRATLISDNYATRFEAERDAMILAGQLSQIQKITGVELTAAEKQLKAAEDQLKALDNILANAKKQIDIARGIDTSIKSVAQAIADLTKALTTGKAGSTKTSGGSTSTSGTVDNGEFTVGGDSSPSEVLKLGQKTKSGKFVIEAPDPSGTYLREVRDDQQIRLEKLSSLYNAAATGGGTLKDLYLGVKNAGYSLLELSAVSGYHYADVIKASNNLGIPRFATGGNHAGGLRIVGDGGGPELEATGPSRIYSAGQTKAMLNNDSLADEVRQLRAELRAIALDQATKANEQLKIQKRWDSDGLPDVRSVA